MTEQPPMIIERLRQRVAELEMLAERYRSLTEHCNDAVVVIDLATGKYIEVNDRAVALFGYSREEMLDMGPGDIVSEHQLVSAAELIEMTKQRGSVSFQYIARRKDGTNLVIDATAALLEGNGQSLVQTVIRDARERDAGEFLRTLLENVPDYIYFKDRHRRFVLASRSFERLLKKEPGEILGKRDEDILPPDIAADPIVDDTRVIEEGIPVLKRVEGGKIVEGVYSWVSTTKLPWRNPDGSIRGLYGISKDITEVKLAELRLQESETRLRAALEAARQAVWELDLTTMSASYDSQYARMLGYEPAELTSEGRDAFAESTHPDDRAVMLATFEAYLGGMLPDYEVEFRLRTKSDGWKWVRSSGRVVARDAQGRPTHMAGTHTDVTHQRRADQDARTHSRVLMSMNEGVNFCDEQGVIQFVNPAMESMFGYDPGELIGQPASVLNAGSAAVRAQVVQHTIRHILQHGHFLGEFRNRKKDDSTFYTKARIFPLERGGEVLFVSIQEDITERKLAEEQLRASLKAKDTLLREVHHRVKNNLQIISSLLHFQSKRVTAPEHVAAFADGRKRLLAMELVHEKLYQARELGKVDFGEYVRSLVRALLQSAHDDNQVHINVVANEIRLPMQSALPCGMILCELVTNVFKYAYPHGRGGTANVLVSRLGDSVQLSVIDHGVGLPSGFETRSARSFGWQLIHNLVNQVDGTIKATSEHGTHVHLVFPLPPAASAGNPHQPVEGV